MKNYGRTSVHEFLGDLIVYRNLVPADPRLPPLSDLRQQAGVPASAIPRKTDPQYGHVLVQLLQLASALDGGRTPLECLVYIGDTQMNDGTAFVNICRAGGWKGLAFIAAERDESPHVRVVEQEEGTLYLANRWAALAEFEAFCQSQGVSIDARTAVIVDLDKTALGARGRNDRVIDRARLEALRRTVADLVAEGVDRRRFEIAYDRLNQVEFHPFTADNQDYLAYICLVLGSGLYHLEPLIAQIRSGQMVSFEQFINAVDDRSTELPAELRHIHRSVYARVQRGDPTPFKAFRHNEYLATIGRMGNLDDSASVARMLEQEIVITQEVRQWALRWREQGALLFGLSDKPDEASVPPGDLAARGCQAIHRTETHAVGG